MLINARTKGRLGDKVLICGENWKEEIIKGQFKRHYGTIVRQYQSDDLSTHGSPLYEIVTVVADADGSKYTDYSCNLESAQKIFFTEEEFDFIVNYKIKKMSQDLEEAKKRYLHEKEMLLREVGNVKAGFNDEI